MTASTDGRRARGAQKRSALIAATMAVIERDGVAGVSHRTVATEVGVAPSSALYYFATLDELLVAALDTAVDEYAERLAQLRAQGRDGIDALARLTAESSTTGRRRALAEWELTLLAVRRPALRPLARRWRDLVTRLAREYTTDRTAIDAFVALVDGLSVDVLLDERPMSATRIARILRSALVEGRTL